MSSDIDENIAEPENEVNFKVIDISKKKKRKTRTRVHYVLDCERRLVQFKKEFKELFNQQLEKNSGSFEDHYGHVFEKMAQK